MILINLQNQIFKNTTEKKITHDQPTKKNINYWMVAIYNVKGCV